MTSLKEVILLLRSNGLDQVLRILRFTIARQRLDTPYLQSLRAQRLSPALTPGELAQVVAHKNGANFSFQHADLQVQFLAADLVRLTWQPGSIPPSYGLKKTIWPEIEIALEEDDQGWLLASPLLRIKVGNQGDLCFMDCSGSVLRQELPPELRGQGTETAWTACIRPEEQEYIYGLGDQAGPFNLAGSKHSLWNTDPGGSFGPGADPLYMPLPVYCCQHPRGSYLVFYENAHAGQVYFAGKNSVEKYELTTVQFDRGAMQYYFIAGALPHALERFCELTGRAELPPLWSLGYHQSRWGYKTEQEIEAVAAGFRANDMPISAIHLDIDYMHGYRVFTVDPTRFPNLLALTTRLDQQGIKTVPIIDPGVKQDKDFPLYQEGMQHDYFCRLPDGELMRGLVWPGWSVYPDFTNSRTRAWWSKKYHSLLDAGAAGIWHDMNEPTSFSGWGGMALPLVTRHDLDGIGGDHLQGHNLYALEMNHAGHQALKEARPDRRPWIISRSGWVSQQRYAWKWSGDTESSWGSLRMTIANALGMGLSGQPYTGPDIGGFSGSPTPELYLRWFQMAAFLPFFRTHSAVGTASREPWVYGEPYTGILRNFLKLRYRLLPYLYTLAWETSRTGHPWVRPLFWADADNRSLWGVDDAFLLGDALLIAPVLQDDAKSRSIQLPRGKWIDYWTKTVYNGDNTVNIPLNLETIPVLVRAGAVLPQTEGGQLNLGFFVPEPSEHWQDPALQLYSDAGDGYGPWRVDSLSVIQENQGTSFTWNSQGEYKFPYARIGLDYYGALPKNVWLDGAPLEFQKTNLLEAPFRKMRLEF